MLALVLALFDASTEISEMVDSVQSNWTKISMIDHFVRSRNRCAQRFLACLLKCKPRKFWKDEIRQVQLLDERPHLARPVILRKLLIQRPPLHLDLVAHRLAHPRPATTRPRRRLLNHKTFEQRRHCLHGLPYHNESGDPP